MIFLTCGRRLGIFTPKRNRGHFVVRPNPGACLDAVVEERIGKGILNNLARSMCDR